jgi:hypothetical protein
MKQFLFTISIIFLCFTGNTQDYSDKIFALHKLTLDFEIQNDQGDMNTKEYLKTYGTKRKTRTLEYMYQIMVPFVSKELEKKQISLKQIEEVATVKSNPYNIPNMGVKKAIKSLEDTDYFLRIAIKDITVINPEAPKTDLSIKMRTLTLRCRLFLLDREKNTIRELEGIFNSGETIESHRDIGIDPRKIRGPEREQELKVYESCCKMAFLKAMDKW